jgi:hypothetical protein
MKEMGHEGPRRELIGELLIKEEKISRKWLCRRGHDSSADLGSGKSYGAPLARLAMSQMLAMAMDMPRINIYNRSVSIIRMERPAENETLLEG